MKSTKAYSYREDIDGLRALAVIPVILYHCNIDSFSGGYTGVDVFFVISGYLITGLIYKDLQKGRFSIAEFYERRIRRILPALTVVVIITSLISFILFLPSDLRAYGKSVIATFSFSSNILFFTESGYFDTPSHTKPLLHTWSLAVEEQYYVFFPLFIYFAYKRSVVFLKNTLIILWVISLAGSIWVVNVNPNAGFYLPQYRAWELFTGSLLAMGIFRYNDSKFILNTIASVGLLMLLYSFFLYTPETRFPGLAALLPCLGTAMIIYSGTQGAPIVSKLLSSPALVAVGLISYSLYLWHWPIIVFTQYYYLGKLNLGATVLVISSSLMLAGLSWKYVETPFRKKQEVFRREILFAVTLLILGSGIAVGFGIYLEDGFPERISRESQIYANGSLDSNPDRTKCHSPDIARIDQGQLCRLGLIKEQTDIVFWGDSHADALMPVFKQLSVKNKRSNAFASYTACAPLAGVKLQRSTPQKGWRCNEFNSAMLRYIERVQPKTVVLIGHWREWIYEGDRFKKKRSSDEFVDNKNTILFNGLRNTLRNLNRLNITAVIIEEVPLVGLNTPRALAMLNETGRDSSILAPKLINHQEEIAGFTDITSHLGDEYSFILVKPSDSMCNEGYCEIESDGRSLYRDEHHLSSHGAISLSSFFQSQIFNNL